MLVDSEDDEEGKGSEEALSSCTEAMALVGGSRAQAAHLNHLTEGEEPLLPAEQPPGREEFLMVL